MHSRKQFFLFKLLFIVTALAASAMAGAAEVSHIYAQEMRWASPKEVQTNYMQTECATIRIASPFVVKQGYNPGPVPEAQKQYGYCAQAANAEMRNPKICSAQVKKDFEEGRPVPSICLWPVGLSSQFKAQKVSTSYDLDTAQMEILNAINDNPGAKNAIEQLIKTVIKQNVREEALKEASSAIGN